MNKFKKFAACALSGVMCFGLAFGAACSGGDEVKGASSEVKSDYIQAIADTYDKLYTSTTGYEITTNGSADISYTEDGVVTDMSYTAKSVASYKYSAGSLGQDQDVFVSGETKYTEDGEEYTESLGAVLSARVRGTAIYGGYEYGTEAYTSVPDDMMYCKIDMTSLLSGDLSDYSDLLGYSDIIGSLISQVSVSSEYTAALASLSDIIESLICGVYGTVETTSSGATLTFDIVKEAEYLLTSAATIVGLIEEDTTVQSLAENETVRSLLEVYLGDLTGSDIKSAFESLLQLADLEEVTLPGATEGQSAYDYILSLYNYIYNIAILSGASSVDLYEYKEDALAVIDECQSAISILKQFTIALNFDDDKNFTGFGLVIDIDGSEEYGISADIQCGMEIAKKNVTLATIDDSKAYIENGYASYGDYDSAEIYFMADGKVVLGFEDEDYNVTYVNTGLTYTLDTDGNIATVDGNAATLTYTGFSLYEYGVTFTYNGVEYSYYYYLEI